MLASDLAGGYFPHSHTSSCDQLLDERFINGKRMGMRNTKDLANTVNLKTRRRISRVAVAGHSLKPRVCGKGSLNVIECTAQLLHTLAPTDSLDQAMSGCFIVNPPDASSSRQPFSKLPSQSNHGIQLNLADKLITNLSQPKVPQNFWKKSM